MENQMERNGEHEMETGAIWGLTKVNLRYYFGETLFTIYTHYDNFI